MMKCLMALTGMWKAYMWKNNGKSKNFIYIVLAFLSVLSMVVTIRLFTVKEEEKQVNVGVVLLGTSDDDGWNESHYKGVLAACKELSCSLSCMENIPEEETKLREAVKELISNGCNVIFLTSYGYGEYADDIACDYPKVAFYSISGDGEADNCTTYYVRMYQVRYLSGMVAASQSKSLLLGAVVSTSMPETNRAINAYVLGARKINPNIKVMVYFTESWNDPKEEERAVEKLVAEGVDVITYHVDKPRVIEAAEDIGIYSVGYEGVYNEYSNRFLTAAVADWEVLYDQVLGDYVSGRANFSNGYWLGLSEGAVSLYPCSNLVSAETRAMVESEKERLHTWRDVFSGEIYDTSGTLRCAKDERFSDHELFYGMDWFVNGVEIYGEDQKN